MYPHLRAHLDYVKVETPLDAVNYTRVRIIKTEKKIDWAIVISGIAYFRHITVAGMATASAGRPTATCGM